MKSRWRTPSRGSMAPVYALFVVGLLALWTVSFPGGSVFRNVTPADVVAGGHLIDTPSLVVSGGLLAVGVAAVLLGLSLLFARVA